jgi:hypothetical protein
MSDESPTVAYTDKSALFLLKVNFLIVIYTDKSALFLLKGNFLIAIYTDKSAKCTTWVAF